VDEEPRTLDRALGENQVLGGKVRIASEGIVSDFEPEKLLARSLLDKLGTFSRRDAALGHVSFANR
jgi:hypothetical protein